MTAFRFDDGETADTRLIGLTFTNGQFGIDGIACAGASPTIEDCRFVRGRNMVGSEAGASPTIRERGGGIGFGDLITLLNAWGPCGACCPPDIDDSGSVGFGDLTSLLNAWGPC